MAASNVTAAITRSFIGHLSVKLNSVDDPLIAHGRPSAGRTSRPVAALLPHLCINDDGITRRFIVMRVHPGDVILIWRSDSIERRLGGVC